MEREIIHIKGQFSKKRIWLPLRVLFTVTGISLVIGVLTVIFRYLLQLRTVATTILNGEILEIETAQSVLGRTFRKVKIIVPLQKVYAIQQETNHRVIHLVVGFGFLTAGLFFGVHWLLDGLGAGYPSLFLLGAFIIVLGMAADIIIHHFIPKGKGRTSISVRTAPWQFRIIGVNKTDAARFVTEAACHLSTENDHTRHAARSANEAASE